MAKRPKWYSEHPRACTCVACERERRRPHSEVPPDGNSLPPTHDPPRRRRSRPPAPDPPEDRGAGRGGFGCISWIAVGVAVILIGSIIANALGTFEFGNGSPPPRPATAPTVPTPTHTVTPIPQASFQEAEPTPTPEPTSTPTPIHTSTPEPTATSTPSPTATPIAYIIQNLRMDSVTASQDLVVVDFSVELKNIRGLDGAGSGVSPIPDGDRRWRA